MNETRSIWVTVAFIYNQQKDAELLYIIIIIISVSFFYDLCEFKWTDWCKGI